MNGEEVEIVFGTVSRLQKRVIAAEARCAELEQAIAAAVQAEREFIAQRLEKLAGSNPKNWYIMLMDEAAAIRARTSQTER